MLLVQLSLLCMVVTTEVAMMPMPSMDHSLLSSNDGLCMISTIIDRSRILKLLLVSITPPIIVTCRCCVGCGCSIHKLCWTPSCCGQIISNCSRWCHCLILRSYCGVRILLLLLYRWICYDLRLRGCLSSPDSNPYSLRLRLLVAGLIIQMILLLVAIDLYRCCLLPIVLLLLHHWRSAYVYLLRSWWWFLTI